PNGEVKDVAIQPDGKVVVTGAFTQVAGVNRLGIARLNRDGTLDTTFLATPIPGTNTFQGEAVALQPDGQILVAGLIYSANQAIFPGFFTSGLWRLNSDGTYDTSFNPGTGAHLSTLPGTVTRLYDVAVQPDGKILACGTFTAFNQIDANRFVRLNSDGSVDSGWVSNMGTGASVGTGGSFPVRSVLVQNDGKVVFGGDFTQFCGVARNYVGRCLATGALDSAFNAFVPATFGGSAPNLNWKVALQHDGKLLLAHDSYKTGAGETTLRRVYSGIVQPAGRFELDAGSYSVTEENTLIIPVRRLGGSLGAVSVSYATYAGTATEGSDYPLTTGFLTWNNSDSSNKNISIAIPNDSTIEVSETFIVQLGTPVGGAWIGETAQALVTIDDAPTATIDPLSKTITSAAQSYNIDVTSATAWMPLENADWIAVSPASGTGNGAVTVTADENPTTASRNTSITIGGRAHLLVQEGAPPFITLAPVSRTVDHTAQTFDIAVTSNTFWSVTESLDWVSVSPGGGSGNGTVTLTIDANASASPRSGSIDIGGETFALTQQGAPPFTAVLPTSKSVDRTAQSYSLSVVSNTAWSVTESLDWVTVSAASGSGNASLTVTVTENTDSAPRLGTVDIGGASHNIAQQAAPAFTNISPASKTVDRTAQSYDIVVDSNTAWTVTESLAWVTVAPASGDHGGTVTVTVSENPATSSRAGTLTIGGQTHTLTQQAAPPFTAIDPASRTVDHSAQSFDVTVDSNTNWTASESLSWVTLSPKTGAGDGTVTVTVQENPDAVPRAGNLTIGGQVLALTQLDAPPFTNLDPADAETDRFPRTYEIAIDSNTAWTVVEALDWIDVSPASGTGDGAVTVTVLENDALPDRMGAFTIGGATHTVTQHGIPVYTNLDPPARAVAEGATVYPVAVASNSDWTVTESLDWVSVDTAAGSGDGTLNLTLDENTGPDARTGEIQIGASLHTITQAGTDSKVILTPAAEIPLPDADPIAWDDAAAGSYDGLLRDLVDGRALVGASGKVRVSKPKAGSGVGGAVSARLRIDGRSVTVRGAFDLNGALDLDLPQRDGSVVEIDLQLMRTVANAGEVLRGAIRWGNVRVVADLPRLPYHAKNNPVPPGLAGRHTFLIPALDGWGDDEPGGDGCGTATIATSGIVTVAGTLGDGTRFTESACLSAENEFSLYQELYRSTPARGRIGGRVVVAETPDVADGHGLVQWKKFADTR
ncbi:MAG: hypothetical protein KDM91_19810, partial [Verrucomicrobiae bacterium]|nr:hypothetical protein [Verrucomicrobiae bacterium]